MTEQVESSMEWLRKKHDAEVIALQEQIIKLTKENEILAENHNVTRTRLAYKNAILNKQKLKKKLKKKSKTTSWLDEAATIKHLEQHPVSEILIESPTDVLERAVIANGGMCLTCGHYKALYCEHDCATRGR